MEFQENHPYGNPGRGEKFLCSASKLPFIINPLNAQLNPICHLLALLGAHHILHISRIRVNIHGSVHRKNILIYIQQDATLHSLFYLETALHVSGGTSTHHQESIQLYLQHLVFVRLPQHTQTSSNSSTIASGSSNDVTNTRCCRYSCIRS
jgi:hypothetical protein